MQHSERCAKLKEAVTRMIMLRVAASLTVHLQMFFCCRLLHLISG